MRNWWTRSRLNPTNWNNDDEQSPPPAQPNSGFGSTPAPAPSITPPPAWPMTPPPPPVEDRPTIGSSPRRLSWSDDPSPLEEDAELDIPPFLRGQRRRVSEAAEPQASADELVLTPPPPVAPTFPGRDHGSGFSLRRDGDFNYADLLEKLRNLVEYVTLPRGVEEFEMVRRRLLSATIHLERQLEQFWSLVLIHEDEFANQDVKEDLRELADLIWRTFDRNQPVNEHTANLLRLLDSLDLSGHGDLRSERRRLTDDVHTLEHRLVRLLERLGIYVDYQRDALPTWEEENFTLKGLRTLDLAFRQIRTFVTNRKRGEEVRLTGQLLELAFGRVPSELHIEALTRWISHEGWEYTQNGRSIVIVRPEAAE